MKRTRLISTGLIGLAFIGGYFYASATMCNPFTDDETDPNCSTVIEETDPKTGDDTVVIDPENDDKATESEGIVGTGELTWVIDEGIRLEESSNPRIMRYENGVIHLAHEYRAKELKDEPGARAYLATSSDGLNFDERIQFQGEEYLGDGILFEDGTQRRYREDMGSGLVVSQSSTNGGVTWEDDEGFRYNLNEIDEGWMGVRTFWVDEDGGVGFIYNTNQLFGPNGEEIHSVRLAYSQPGDMGMNFELVDENPIEDYFTSDTLQEMMADPHAIYLSDGRVRLIGMRQDHDRSKPPHEANGTIVSYISDDGLSFEYEGEIVAWDDFTEFDVISLNDPKIMELEDGRFRVYVAAWIPDETISEEDRGTTVDGIIIGWKWVIVSITTELN